MSISIFDVMFASGEEKTNARIMADRMIQRHGAAAEEHLRQKLTDPERQRSLRTIRLALKELARRKK